MSIPSMRRLLLPVASIVAGVVLGPVAWRWSDAAVETARSRAADAGRAEGLLDQRAAWDLAAGARRNSAESILPMLLDGASDAEAAAALDALLRSWVALHGGQLFGIEVLPAEGDGVLATARARLRFRGGFDAIAGVLEKIEYGPRLLTVERFTVLQDADGLAADILVAGWFAKEPAS